MARFGRVSWGTGAWFSMVGIMLLGLAPPAGATLRYGPIELSGSVDSQTLLS